MPGNRPLPIKTSLLHPPQEAMFIPRGFASPRLNLALERTPTRAAASPAAARSRLLTPTPTILVDGDIDAMRVRALARSADRLMPSRFLMETSGEAGLFARARSSTFDSASPRRLIEPREAARIAQIGATLGLEPPNRPLLKMSPTSVKAVDDWKTAMKKRSGPPIADVKPCKILDFPDGVFCSWSPSKKNLFAALLEAGACACFTDCTEPTGSQKNVRSIAEDIPFVDVQFSCDGTKAAILEVTGRVIVLDVATLQGDAFRALDRKKSGICLKLCAHPTDPRILAWCDATPSGTSGVVLSLCVVDLRANNTASSTSKLGCEMKMVAHSRLPSQRLRVTDNASPGKSVDLHGDLPLVSLTAYHGFAVAVDYRKGTEPLVNLPAHSEFCSTVAFLPDSGWGLMTAGNDGVKIFDHRTSSKRFEYLSEAPVTSLVTNADKNELLVSLKNLVTHVDYGKTYNSVLLGLDRLDVMGYLNFNPVYGTGLVSALYSPLSSTLSTVQLDDEDVETINFFSQVEEEDGFFSKFFPKEKLTVPSSTRRTASASGARPKQLFSSPLSMFMR